MANFFVNRHAMLLPTLWLLLACMAAQAAAQFYANSQVFEVSSRTFTPVVLDTHHLTLVEFYAPWCGYCQKLTPEYIRAAAKLAGIVKVAAINCDEDANKAICGKYRVEGFPSLKVFGPRKKAAADAIKGPASDVLEDYTGPRTAKGIVDAMLYKFNGAAFGKLRAVSSEKGVDSLLADTATTRVVLLPKGSSSTPPPLFRSLSIDFRADDAVTFAFTKNSAALRPRLAQKLGLPELAPGAASSSTLLVISAGDDAKPAVYDGPLKREPVQTFLQKFAKRTDPIDRRGAAGPKDRTKKGGPGSPKKKKTTAGGSKRRDEL